MRGLIFLGLLACVHGLGNTVPYHNHWDHDYGTQTAKNWIADACANGNKQSPIDIDTKAVKVAKPDPGPIMAYGFGADRPIGVQIDGTKTARPTAVIAYYPDGAIRSSDEGKKSGTATPIIVGGPLEQAYQFSHIEFHHGKIAGTNPASEHTFDGTRPMMSMNVIFTKTEWNAAKEALRFGHNIGVNYDLAVTASSNGDIDPAGIAVIAYSIDVGDENKQLDPIAKALDKAGSDAKADFATKIPFSTDAAAVATWTPGAGNNVNMSALMMLDEGALEDYYYYDGSLTQPAGHQANTNALRAVSCAEIVRWIIPTKRLTMTAAQMAYWNENSNFLVNGGGPTAWARSVQTGDRIKDITVKRRMPVKTTDDAIWRNLASTLLSVGTFGLVHNMLTQDETAKALTENPVVDILQDIEQRFVRPAAPQERQSFNHHHHPQDIQY